MKKFIDANGGEWSVDIHAVSISKVRDEVDVDLIEWATGTGEEVAKAASDPVTIVRVMCSLLSEEIKRRGMSETDFAKCLCGDGLENAVIALVEDLIDFFPKSKAALLRTMNEKNRATESALVAKMQAEIDSGAIDAVLKQPLRQFETICSTVVESLESVNQGKEPTET